MDKIEVYVRSGIVLAWIESWLMDGKQRVGINVCFSEWQAATSGIPQGPVVGAIHKHDLDEGNKSNSSKFVDDTKIGGIVSCVEDGKRFQRDSNKFSELPNTWLNVKLYHSVSKKRRGKVLFER